MKALIPLHGNDVAPRFDLATEVLIATGNKGETEWDEHIVVLPQSSAEQLCHLVVTEGVEAVICNGIEDEHFQYLTWKRVTVYDSVIGPWKQALAMLFTDNLQSGKIIRGGRNT